MAADARREGGPGGAQYDPRAAARGTGADRKSTRLNSSHSQISYAVFCLKKKKQNVFVDQSANSRMNKTMANNDTDPYGNTLNMPTPENRMHDACAHSLPAANHVCPTPANL